MRAITTPTDSTCGMTVDPATAVGRREWNGDVYYFCCDSSKAKTNTDPSRFAGHADDAGHDARQSRAAGAPMSGSSSPTPARSPDRCSAAGCTGSAALRSLELKVPPLAVVVGAAALMWAASRAAPAFGVALPGRATLAAGLAVAGALTSALGVAAFRRARTTVNPMRPELSSALVVSGVYRLTRNPMYLGFLLLLLAWAVLLSNVLALTVVPAFVLYMNRFQIAPEERALSSAFGPEYVAYKARVRPWL
jgi:protein-S-isoprenylcysteine O-methyltransferase Ste14/YHS domain-containing protein